MADDIRVIISPPVAQINTIPDGTVKTGSVLSTNVADPVAPVTGSTSTYTSATDKRFHDKNDAGVVGTTIVPQAGVANNFVTGISPAGVLSFAVPPALANIITPGTVGSTTLTPVITYNAQGLITGVVTASTTPSLPNIITAGSVGSALLIPAITYNAQGLITAISTAPNTGDWSVAKISGADVTTTGQILVDITGLVSVSLLPSTLYQIWATLLCTTTSDINGNQYGIHCAGTGTPGTCNALLRGTLATATASSQTINAIDTPSTALMTGPGSGPDMNGTVEINGWVTTTGSGTVTISLQHLKVVSGTSKVKIGSILRYRKA